MTNHDRSFGANQNHSFEEIEISAGSNSKNDSLAPHYGEICVSNGGSQSNKSIPTGNALAICQPEDLTCAAQRAARNSIIEKRKIVIDQVMDQLLIEQVRQNNGIGWL